MVASALAQLICMSRWNVAKWARDKSQPRGKEIEWVHHFAGNYHYLNRRFFFFFFVSSSISNCFARLARRVGQVAGRSGQLAEGARAFYLAGRRATNLAAGENPIKPTWRRRAKQCGQNIFAPCSSPLAGAKPEARASERAKVADSQKFE